MDKTTYTLTEGWKFYLGECEEAWYQGFDDTNFTKVTLPHDWAVEYPFSKEYSSGTGYLRGGIGWYRLHFHLPKDCRGKSIRLVFDGVYKNSQVWVNSYYQGKHPYGYTGFTYDISEIAHFGTEENVISVKVTHTDIADSRWYTGSGITRKVTLLIEEKLHPAEDGIYFVTDEIESGTAKVHIHQEIVNQTAEEQNILLVTKLMETDGTLKAEFRENVRVVAGQTTVCELRGLVEHPKLWSVDEPYLYRMETRYEKNGTKEAYLVDVQSVGIRTVKFDEKQGFFLNGSGLKIKGVCLHHDAGCLGAAVTKEVWRRRLKTLKRCGCNAIRCSHNPHMPELYDLCDEMGFLMMDEAFDEWENAKNKWSTGHNVYPPKHQGYFEDFPEWHEKDLRGMVRRDRRHPSVILWSIGNEIDYPNDPYCHPSFRSMTGNNDAKKPAAERQYDPAKPDMTRIVSIAGELADIVRSEDESRPVTMALAYPELSTRIGILQKLDVAGYNYKEQYYEEDHVRFPGMPFLGSENGHGYEAWRAVTEHDFICGQFLWTGIDYLGEAHGWPIHGSGAGLLNCAGFEKSRFYQRQSFWREEPVIALATREYKEREDNNIPYTMNWNYIPGQRVTVMCYSNLPETAILINGKEIARQKEYNDDGAYRFDVVWESGTLEAVGYDEAGNQECRTKIETTTAVSKIGADVDWCEGKEDTQQIGYLYQMAVTLLDESGRIVTWDDRTIQVQTTGAGELAGLENGDLSDVTPYLLPERKTKDGRLMVYIRRTGAGKITAAITARPLCADEGGMYLEVEMD